MKRALGFFLLVCVALLEAVENGLKVLVVDCHFVTSMVVRR